MEVQGTDQHSTNVFLSHFEERMAPDYCRGGSLYVRAVSCYIAVQFVADKRQHKFDDKAQWDRGGLVRIFMHTLILTNFSLKILK